MSITWPTRLLIAGGILLTGGYAYWRWDSSRKTEAEIQRRRAAKNALVKKAKTKDAISAECLQAYLQSGARLAEQIRQGLTYSQRFVDDRETIDLNTRTQTRVFSTASRLANAGETGDLDRATMLILREVMPDCAWDSIAQPFESGSDWEIAYDGVKELLQIAALEMRYEDFHIYGSSGNVGLICPGWKNMAPAPTGNLSVGDTIEILIGAEDDNSEPILEEVAYADVLRIEGETVVAVIIESDSRSTNLNSDAHGYYVGMEVRLHRRCIWAVRKKAN